MSRVVVLGAGDFGRELGAWVRHDQIFLNGDPLVFYDDDLSAFDRQPHLKNQLLGTISEYVPLSTDRVILGISDPQVKRSIDLRLTERGVKFSTFVHRSVILAEDCSIGEGSVICPNALVSTGAEIGRLVTVNVHATVGHDALIANYASLMSHVDVTGWAKIGEASFLGSHASVLPNVVVEAEAIVGAGSVVLRKVARGTKVIGVPAKRI